MLKSLKQKHSTTVLNKQDYLEPSFWSKTSLIQIGYALWACLIMLIIGLIVGFPAIIIPRLREAHSKIQSTISEDALIVGVMLLSSTTGNVISAFLVDKVGRRAIMIACVVPFICGWFTVGFAGTVVIIVIGQSILGLGVGLVSGSARAYCSEIAMPNMRGLIGCIPAMAISLGVTIQATLGAFCHWRTVCYVSGSISIMTLISNCFLPETPYFSLMKGNMEDTLKCLKKFRGKHYKAESEWEELKKFHENVQLRRLSTREAVKLLFSPLSCKPFMMILTYIFIGQLSGHGVLIFWLVVILQHSNLSISPYHGNIIINMIRLVAGLVSSLIIFKVRRRVLALTSAFGISCVCWSLAAYIMSSEQATIFPLIGYISFVILGSFGYYALPLFILMEISPLQIRGLLSGICLSLSDCISFSMNYSFAYLLRALHITGTLILFGAVSFGGFIFLYTFLPETKGLSLSSIEQNNRKISLVKIEDGKDEPIKPKTTSPKK